MPNWTVGQKVEFNSYKNSAFELKEIIPAPNMNLDWEWDRGDCPHCKKNIKVKTKYKLARVFIFESEKVAGNGAKVVRMFGETEAAEGKSPLFMRLPDKTFHIAEDMTSIVKDKSEYLKGVKNGD